MFISIILSGLNMENRREIKKLIRYLGIFLIACSIFISGVFIGRLNLKSLNDVNYLITGELKSEYQNVDVNIIWETWQKLQQEYLSSSEIDPQDLVYGAAKGLVSSLEDPYTAFLTPSEVMEYYKSNAGEYEGIGATLKQEGSYVAVESPIDGSPAEKAGLKPSDLILKVDDVDVVNKSVYEVVSLIRGDAGSSVIIEVYRSEEQKELVFSIKREKIDIDNVSYEDLGQGYYLVKIYKFTEADLEQFNAMWDKVISEISSKNPKGIIVDLRNNPGGYVSAVEYALGDFIGSGKVVFYEEGKNGVKVEHKIARNGKLLDVPLLVMVNAGSASASEIFAGAIKDHGRGKVIGEETVGKGVEQKLITLSDGSILQVVFQRWLTPLGKNISKDDPITPDIIIEDEELTNAKALEILKSE